LVNVIDPGAIPALNIKAWRVKGKIISQTTTTIVRARAKRYDFRTGGEINPEILLNF